MNVEVIDTPDFLSELLLSYNQESNIFDIKKDYELYHKTEEEMNNMIGPIQVFCQQMQGQFSAILKRFPKLEKLLELTEKEKEEGGLLWYYYEHLKLAKKNGEENLVDEVFCAFFPEEEPFKGIEEVLSFLDRSKFDDGYKMKIISLYMNREEIMEQLLTVKDEVLGFSNKPYLFIKDIVDVEVERMRDDNYLESVMESSVRISLEQGKQLYIIPRVNSFLSCGISSYKSSYCLHMGIYVGELVEQIKRKPINTTQLALELKIVGDVTRLKILQMLSEKQMYIQEMADVLELTPATISHHTNALLAEGFISLTVDATKSKKIYYKKHNEKLVELSRSILELADYNDD